MRYTAEFIRKEVDKNKSRLFASYSENRPPGWNTDIRTQDMICLEKWLSEELSRIVSNETDRRTQLHFYNRWCRSDEDLFDLGARCLNAVLDGQVQQNRVPHHRWG